MYKAAFACMLAVPLLALAHGSVYSPPPNQQSGNDATLQAREALRQFNQTTPFLGRTDRNSVQSDLAQQCPGLSPKCVDYVRTSHREVLGALPDNPQYWMHFWRYLETSPVGVDPDPSAKSWSDPSTSYSELLQAMTNWVVYYMAKDGILDADRTISFATHVRRLANDSTLVIDKMMFLAGLGVAQRALNIAMSQAVATGNADDLGRLVSQLKPFSQDERSFRRVFEGESNYGRALIAAYPRTPQTLLELQRELHDRYVELGMPVPELGLPEPELATDFEMETWHVDAQRHLRDGLVIREAVAQISERSASEYWGRGDDVLQQGLVEARPTDHPDFDPWLGWGPLIHGYRTLDLHYLMLQALSDAYAGRVVAGIPARPAPAHWAWEWLEIEQDLCLVPVSVHPTVVREVERICSHYWVLPAGIYRASVTRQ